MASKNINMKETFVKILLFSMDFIHSAKKLLIRYRLSQIVALNSIHNNPQI